MVAISWNSMRSPCDKVVEKSCRVLGLPLFLDRQRVGALVAELCEMVHRHSDDYGDLFFCGEKCVIITFQWRNWPVFRGISSGENDFWKHLRKWPSKKFWLVLQIYIQSKLFPKVVFEGDYEGYFHQKRNPFCGKEHLCRNSFTKSMCAGEELKCHKIILCKNSPFFKAMLGYDFKESGDNQMRVRDVPRQTVVDFLEYIYKADMSKITEGGIDIGFSMYRPIQGHEC